MTLHYLDTHGVTRKAERLETAPWVQGHRWLIDDEWVAQIPDWAWRLVKIL